MRQDFFGIKICKRKLRNVIYLDFYNDARFNPIFESALDVDTICSYISLLVGPSTNFVPGNTCFMLDEIQQCPKGRTSLKYFKIDGRYDVIGTGSLLGVQGYSEDEPIPVTVGYETVVNMYPMDFEEFLWANDIPEKIIDQIQTVKIILSLSQILYTI